MRFFSVVSFFCFSSHTVQVNVLVSLLFVSLFTNGTKFIYLFSDRRWEPVKLSGCQVDPSDMHMQNNFYFWYKYLSLLRGRPKKKSGQK